MTVKLILASASPRRRQLLDLFGLAFEVIEADLDESAREGESAEAMSRRLAETKARRIYHRRGRGHAVLGGDTVVAIDGRALGKPRDPGEATSMLQQLSGRDHHVLSAVALVSDKGTEVRLSQTRVRFCELGTAVIARYCDSGEPYDKAGGYGIQGIAGAFVEELHGSHSGVVGLPLLETRLLLESAGLLPT